MHFCLRRQYLKCLATETPRTSREYHTDNLKLNIWSVIFFFSLLPLVPQNSPFLQIRGGANLVFTVSRRYLWIETDKRSLYGQRRRVVNKPTRDSLSTHRISRCQNTFVCRQAGRWLTGEMLKVKEKSWSIKGEEQRAQRGMFNLTCVSSPIKRVVVWIIELDLPQKHRLGMKRKDKGMRI